MAIDRDIEQRVNAYRGNPQALQKRYAANQELLDLLALQRLKSEKDDAMRKVQMEMEQNPQTIKQQTERALLDMTKQDLVNQTAGIMQNAQKRQQKNMQRVAKQGAAAPQQVQQLQSGLGALAKRQQQQAPQQAPMRRMAAGGIVAFANGGEITQEDIDRYRRSGGQSRRARAKLTDEQIRAILEKQRGPDTSGYEMVQTSRGLRRRPMALAPVDTESPVETAEFDEKEETTEVMQLDGTQVREEVTGEEVVDAPAEETQVEETAVEEPPKPQGIMDLFQQQPKLTAPKVDLAGAGSGATDLLKSAGITTGTDPEAARIKARDESEQFLGRQEKRDKMNKYLEELKAMDARQQDPKKMRDEQISAFLRGTAGGGSFGQTMAGGSGAMASERQRQEKSERDRLLSRIGIDQTAMTMDADLAKQALSDGRSAYEQSMAHQRTAAQVMSQMRGQDLQVATANANREFEANSNNVKNLLSAANIQYTNDLRLTMESADRRAAAGKTLGQIQNDKATFIQDYVSNDPAVIQAENIALTSNDPDAAAAATEARRLAEIKALGLLDKAGILDTEKALRDIMDSGGTGGTVPTAPTMPNFNLSEEGNTAYQRYKPQ